MNDLKYLATDFAISFLTLCPEATIEEKKDFISYMQRMYTQSRNVLYIGKILHKVDPSINKINIINVLRNTGVEFAPYLFYTTLDIFARNFRELITENNMINLIKSGLSTVIFATLFEEIKKTNTKNAQRLISQKFFDEVVQLKPFSYSATHIIRYLRLLNPCLINEKNIKKILTSDITAQENLSLGLQHLATAKARYKAFKFDAAFFNKMAAKPSETITIASVIAALSLSPGLLSQQNINTIFTHNNLNHLSETWENLMSIRQDFGTQENFERVFTYNPCPNSLKRVLRDLRFHNILSNSLWDLLQHSEKTIAAEQLLSCLKNNGSNQIAQALLQSTLFEQILKGFNNQDFLKLLKTLRDIDLEIVLQYPEKALSYLQTVSTLSEICSHALSKEVRLLVIQKNEQAQHIFELLESLEEETRKLLTAENLKTLLISQVEKMADLLRSIIGKSITAPCIHLNQISGNKRLLQESESRRIKTKVSQNGDLLNAPLTFSSNSYSEKPIKKPSL